MGAEEKNYTSPINGAPLTRREDGLYGSEYDETLYMVAESGEIIPLKSPLHGGTLTRREDGLYGSEYGEILYKVEESGKITPLTSPNNGSLLYPNGDGTYYSEYDNLIYIIDEDGKITVKDSISEKMPNENNEIEDSSKLDSTSRGISQKLGNEVITEILDASLEDQTQLAIEEQLNNLHKSTEEKEK